MAVLIEIKVEDNQRQEYNAIKTLKVLLEEDFAKNYPEAKGRISLYASLNLYGCNGRGVSDLDVLIMGQLEGVQMNLNYTPRNGGDSIESPYVVNSFILTIEQKSHSDGIAFENTNFYVPYRDGLKNVSQQSRDQKDAMRVFLNCFGLSPIVNNLIWFTGITFEQLPSCTHGCPHNAVAGNITLKDLMQARLNSFSSARLEGNNRVLRMSDDPTMFDAVTHLFERKQVKISEGITRRKLELINNRCIAEDSKTILGNQFSILEGRAGTGKTITLLQAAMYKSQMSPCVILTYNYALLGDIRRLIQYRSISEHLFYENLKTQTIGEFFKRLAREYDIPDGQYDLQLNALENKLNTLEECKRQESIFIDEAQDWSIQERNILFKLYEPQNIIVADGVDQFVRYDSVMNWEDICNNTQKIVKTKSLRQKQNLVQFVNAFAYNNGLEWNVEENSQLTGGRVIVKPLDGYIKHFHKEMEVYCRENDCTNYDIMFLVTPAYVGEEGFKCRTNFEKCNVALFDGTSATTRRSIPMGNDECRIFQYDSCRGLEGWIVVCVEFDELVQYKQIQFEQQMAATNIDATEVARRRAILWSLMPLTRAIDTLVITLKNPEGEIGKILKDLSKNYEFISWDI